MQGAGARVLRLQVSKLRFELPGTSVTKKHWFSKGLRVETGRSDLLLDSTCKMRELSDEVLELEVGLTSKEPMPYSQDQKSIST